MLQDLQFILDFFEIDVAVLGRGVISCGLGDRMNWMRRLGVTWLRSALCNRVASEQKEIGRHTDRPEVAQQIYRDLKTRFNVFYDEKGAVGRRYRREDEAGTPYCITVDGQSLQDGTVTVRDRDTLEQWRVKVDDCVDEISRLINSGGQQR